MKETYHKS